MLVNDKILNITETVHDILRSKITAGSKTRLWIDAVCINQEDLVEKATQVGLMGEVYTNAISTRVWLGPVKLESDLALRFTQDLFDILPQLETGKPEWVSYHHNRYPEGCPEWVALAHFLNRSWFSRTWVIQEVALASRVEIVCGDSLLRWDVLERVMVGLSAMGFDGWLHVQDSGTIFKGAFGHTTICGLSRLRSCVKAGKLRPILRVVAGFHNCQSTVESDKIYAMLGIATDAADDAFFPDCTKSSLTLFEDITKVLIASNTALDVLRYAGVEPDSEASSWSVKLLKTQCATRFGLYPITAIEKLDFSFSDDNKHLNLRALILDKVNRLGTVCGYAGFQDASSSKDTEVTNYFDSYLQAKAMTQSAGRDEEALWRTLLANRISTSEDFSFETPEQPPDEPWKEAFRAFETVFAQIFRGMSPVEVMRLITGREGLEAMKFRHQLCRAIACRRFCVLDSGSLGLMPKYAQTGDFVAAFLSAKVLFAVRPLPADESGLSRYQLVGECYVHDANGWPGDGDGVDSPGCYARVSVHSSRTFSVASRRVKVKEVKEWTPLILQIAGSHCDRNKHINSLKRGARGLAAIK